jgi:hypothetical protein
MKLKSLYPPISIQGPSSGRWYIIAGGIWHEVKRKYEWNELESMWEKTSQIKPKERTEVKKEWKVKGSKGNVYNVVNDGGFWTCSCPAHGFGRGKDCKHIIAIHKNKTYESK